MPADNPEVFAVSVMNPGVAVELAEAESQLVPPLEVLFTLKFAPETPEVTISKAGAGLILPGAANNDTAVGVTPRRLVGPAPETIRVIGNDWGELTAPFPETVTVPE